LYNGTIITFVWKNTWRLLRNQWVGFGWAQVGFSFFATGVIICVLDPLLLPYKCVQKRSSITGPSPLSTTGCSS
jgi:hypothetical protein